jgi:hypothetical protein
LYLSFACCRRSARHLRQYLASIGARNRLPSSIVPPQLWQVMAALFVLRDGIENRKLRAEPIDRFLNLPPVAHPLAVSQPLLADVFFVLHFWSRPLGNQSNSSQILRIISAIHLLRSRLRNLLRGGIEDLGIGCGKQRRRERNGASPSEMELPNRGIAANVAWNSSGSFHNDAFKDLKAEFTPANLHFSDGNLRGELLREDKRWVCGVLLAAACTF